MAVSPFLSTALRSLPRSSATLTASSTSGSVPGSSPGALVPRPAATISGVDPSSLVRSGLAPSSASSFMSGASAVRAARRNGVAPIELSVVTPMLGRFVTRASMRRTFRHELSHEREAVHVARPLRRGVVAAGDSGFPDPRDLMERGVALRSGVGIGAAVEQPCRQLVVGVGCGQQEGIRPRSRERRAQPRRSVPAVVARAASRSCRRRL